jgi:hypothetical protein
MYWLSTLPLLHSLIFLNLVLLNMEFPAEPETEANERIRTMEILSNTANRSEENSGVMMDHQNNQRA